MAPLGSYDSFASRVLLGRNFLFLGPRPFWVSVLPSPCLYFSLCFVVLLFPAPWVSLREFPRNALCWLIASRAELLSHRATMSTGGYHKHVMAATSFSGAPLAGAIEELTLGSPFFQTQGRTETYANQRAAWEKLAPRETRCEIINVHMTNSRSAASYVDSCLMHFPHAH